MKTLAKSVKKLRIVKSTIQNLNNLERREVRGGGDSVKAGYPCVFDPEATMYVTEAGYGVTCPSWQC